MPKVCDQDWFKPFITLHAERYINQLNYPKEYEPMEKLSEYLNLRRELRKYVTYHADNNSY